VDIDSIKDNIDKKATISQISNFGQTPRQLFKKPHPKRIINDDLMNSLTIFNKTNEIVETERVNILIYSETI
jgi:hypothetical protein